MRKTIYDFEKKYDIQNGLLETGSLVGLDERTLHSTIKAMLINTIKDCIKYENWMDPAMEEISQLIIKENKTEEEMRKIKNAQDRLRASLHYSKISEESLYNLLYQILSTDRIKQCFKQEIPLIVGNLYYLVDMEQDIAESLAFTFAELYEVPSYKDICAVINNTIADFIENAEEYIEDIQEHDYYEQFVSYREQLRKEKKENANE